MNKVITVLLLVSSISFGQLAISAVFDGPLTGGVPKGVELYASGNIADLSVYGIGSANNGGGTDGEEFTFPSVAVNAGTYIYVASEETGFNSFFGFLPDYTTGAMSINGDDAIELFKNGTVVDLFGDINVDGTGEAWDHLDGWAASKSSRTASTVFDPDDWTFSGPNALDGETTNASAANPVPIGVNTPLPVELTTFSAVVSNQSVALNWETATEVNNYGFEVERQYQVSSNENQVWEKVGFVEGHGNSNSPKYYSFTDSKINGSGKYFYRLKQIDIDGKFEYSDVVEANLGSPLQFELTQNYPNPFNPTTSIQFNLPEDSQIRLSVFNVLGEEVTELVNGKITAGFHNVKFDGSKFNSGIYFYKLEAENFVQIRKMMLVK